MSNRIPSSINSLPFSPWIDYPKIFDRLYYNFWWWWDFSLQRRVVERKERAKRKLLNFSLTIVSEMLADKRGHCFRDLFRILSTGVATKWQNVPVALRSTGSRETSFVSRSLTEATDVPRLGILGRRIRRTPTQITKNLWHRERLLFVLFASQFVYTRPQLSRTWRKFRMICLIVAWTNERK